MLDFHQTLFYLPALFTTLVGLSILQFKDLYSKVKHKLLSNQLHDTSETKQKVGRPRILSGESQLCLTLLWMRQYPTESMLSWLFEIPTSLVYKYTRSTLEILYTYTVSSIQFPSYNYRMSHAVPFRGRYVVVLIDGTEQQICIPYYKDNEKKTFSGKKGMCTFTKLIVCSPQGEIYYVSPSYTGSQTDQVLIAKAENAVYDWLTWLEAIVVDSGFKNLPDLCRNKCQCILPFLDSLAKYFSEEDDEFQREHKRIRVVVENVIAQVKKWKICRERFRAKHADLEIVLEEHQKVWHIACALVNMYVETIRDV